MDKVFYAPITKTDDELRMVYGYATTETLDSQGEIVKQEAVLNALEDYMKWANIREMHQPSAVGKTKEAKIDNKGLYIAAKVVDEEAWKKVKEGVYSGFSIGGRVKVMKGKEIHDMTMTEISLVDRPANPDAKFDVWKSEDKPIINSSESMDINKVVEEKLAKLEVPTDAEIVKYLEENKLPTDEKTIGATLKFFTDKVFSAVAKSIDDQKNIDADKVEKEVVKAEDKVEEKPIEEPKKEETKELKKSMYDVQCMADVLTDLHYIEESLEFQAEYTANGNTELIDKLNSIMKEASDVLKQMVDDETRKLIRAEDAEKMEKRGAKFSATTKKTIMTKIKSFMKEISDMMEDPQEKSDTTLEVAKAEEGKELSKAEMAKVEAEITSLKEQIQKLADTPLPIKAVASFTVEKRVADASQSELEDKEAELAKAEKRASEIQESFSKGIVTPELRNEASDLGLKILDLKRYVKPAA